MPNATSMNRGGTVLEVVSPYDHETIIPLADVLAEMLAAKRAAGISQAQLGAYQQNIGGFIRYLMAQGRHPTVDDLNLRNARGFLEYLGTEYLSENVLTGVQVSLSPRTVREWGMCLKSFSRWLWREEITPRYSLDRLQLPRLERAVLPIFTEAQIDALISHAVHRRSWWGRRDVALILFLLDSLCRVSEACELTCGRLELDYSPDLGRARIWGKKTGRERYVYLSPQTVQAMTRYLAEVPSREPTDPVFRTRAANSLASEIGGPTDRNTVRQMLLKLGRRAGLTGVRCTPHTIRHTGATWYAKKGMTVPALQELLGHTTPKMALYYVHLAQADVENQARAAAPVAALAPMLMGQVDP